MSLHDWSDQGWLSKQEVSPQAIADLLAGARRDLHDCGANLSPDWRLSIAHNAALLVATAALAACGYRCSRDSYHFRVLQSLAHTIGLERPVLVRLDVFRKKRNISGYTRAGTIEEQEAGEMVALARELLGRVEAWLRAEHPELMEE
jgi:hypothetical protein